VYLRTCVSPLGKFVFGIHKPAFRTDNLRENDAVTVLGYFEDGSPFENRENFPESDVEAEKGDVIFEIPNAFPFRGTTYIRKSWADAKAMDPSFIALPEAPPVSFSKVLEEWLNEDNNTSNKIGLAFETLPEPLLIALAKTSTDPDDLVRMANLSCEFVYDDSQRKPMGLRFTKNQKGDPRPVINNRVLFEVIINNPHLPDAYKNAMVLKPGIQGTSEIVGEFGKQKDNSHVFEYLRCNSYIPWGHHAANMANDVVRYRIHDLTEEDMKGLRHLYYQRTFIKLASILGIKAPGERRSLSEFELEEMRKHVLSGLRLQKGGQLSFNSTLWGWNFGFDFAPSHYRLHASHQQVHQQFALIPSKVPSNTYSGEETENELLSYACGDMIHEFITSYRTKTGHSFFKDYIRAIRSNIRMDDNSTKEKSLIVYEDKNIMLFVPKAQTSQWELQLMTLKHVGNILEADTDVRGSLDHAMLLCMKILEKMGAKMVTTIEYSKRFDSDDNDQRLLYSFLPKLPESPGAFSEAQLRWINGHYPEDFAAACRAAFQT
jgi:hypothetical protein